MRIIICDDEKSIQFLLKQKTACFFAKKNISCEILCCDSGEEVLTLTRQGVSIDLLFLDIQMPGRNGMEIAKELRRQHKNISIIFVTALSDYVYEAFDVNALHYLVKPFADEKLEQVLDKAIRLYQQRTDMSERYQQAQHYPKQRYQQTHYCQKEYLKNADSGENATAWELAQPRAILVKRGGLSTKVLLSEIIYAEVFNRKVMLHTVHGDIEYYGKLTDLSEQAGEDFYRTHRAYLVNLNYVEKYNATTVWLEQGTAIISKKQFPGFVQQYMRYLNRQKNAEENKMH